MSRRDELLGRFQAVRDSLVEIAAALASIRSDIVDVADRETASGHHGIADAYRSAADQGEDVADLLVVADDGLCAVIGSISVIGTAHDPGTSASPPRAVIDFAEPGEPTIYDPKFEYERHRQAIRRFGWKRNKNGRASARGLIRHERATCPPCPVEGPPQGHLRCAGVEGTVAQ